MAVVSINAGLQNVIINPSDPFKNLTRENQMLNDGAFGRVYRCFNQTDGKVDCAVKEVDVPAKEPGRSDILKIIDQEYTANIALEKLTLHHRNIVRILHCIKTDVKLLVFMEYMDGGDLSSFISFRGKQDDQTVLGFLEQIASGLMFLHSSGIAHYDLKSGNILLDNAVHPNTLKISDYGTSKVFSTGNATTVRFKGTILFIAPEVYAARLNPSKKREDQATFNKFSEIWSLGVIGLHLVTGELAWNYPSDVQNELNRYTITTQERNPVARVLKRLLVIDPQNRCDLATVMNLTENKQLPEVTCTIYSPGLQDNQELKSQMVNHFTHHHIDDDAVKVALQITKSFYNYNWFAMSCNSNDDVSGNGHINVTVDDRQHMFYHYCDHPSWKDATEESVISYLNSIQWATKSAWEVRSALNIHFGGHWLCVVSSDNDTNDYLVDIIVRHNNGFKFITVIRCHNY